MRGHVSITFEVADSEVPTFGIERHEELPLSEAGHSRSSVPSAALGDGTLHGPIVQLHECLNFEEDNVPRAHLAVFLRAWAIPSRKCGHVVR